MDILILGAGSLGSLLGARLSQKNRVCLFSLDKEHINAIRSRGLIIEELDGGTSHYKEIETALSPHQIPFVPELILITLKTYSLENGIRSVRDISSPSTIFLTLQNGLGNIETMVRIIPSGQVMAGVTAQGATLIKGGVVRHGGNGPTYIGEIDGKPSHRVKEVVRIFNESSLLCEATSNIHALIWRKLLINIGINAITALLGIPNEGISKNPWAREVAKRAVEEGCRICEKEGIPLQQEDIFSVVEEVSLKTGRNISSMRQDIINQHPTEIDAINGAIVRKGEELGIETPINWTLTHLIKALEEKARDAKSNK